MLPEKAVAVIFLGQKMSPGAAQIVETTIFDTPKIGDPRSRAGYLEETVAVVNKRRTQRESPFAKVIDAYVPIRSDRRLVHAKQLITVPTGKYLCTKNAVVLNLYAANVVRRVGKVGSHHGPIKDRHIAQEKQTVPRRCQPLMIHDLLTADGINQRLAAEAIEHGSLDVFVMDSAGLDSITGPTHAAGG